MHHILVYNINRGCLAQYVGVLDSPWSNVAESIEALWHNSIKTDKGIEEVIKTLEAKLSEAIMYAMENGPDLEKKVSTHTNSFIIYTQNINTIYK